MEYVTTRKKEVSKAEPLDLFAVSGPAGGADLRAAEQRERLLRLAKDLGKLLDNLQLELSMDREGAISLLAECTGLIEMAAEELSQIRDIDEEFGGTKARPLRVATLAQKTERGLAYLLGIFSVVGSGENLSEYNWKLVTRDIQSVLDGARELESELRPVELKQAA